MGFLSYHIKNPILLLYSLTNKQESIPSDTVLNIKRAIKPDIYIILSASWYRFVETFSIQLVNNQCLGVKLDRTIIK